MTRWSEMKSLSRVWLFATPWTVAYRASLSMGFSRQEYWSGLPFPSPGDLLNPGIQPRFPALKTDFLLSEPPGKPWHSLSVLEIWFIERRLSINSKNVFDWCDILAMVWGLGLCPQEIHRIFGRRNIIKLLKGKHIKFCNRQMNKTLWNSRRSYLCCLRAWWRVHREHGTWVGKATESMVWRVIERGWEWHSS